MHLLDQNDQCPQFTLSTTIFSALESLEVGKEVDRIIAKDADETSVLVYTMVGIYSDFAINSATGQILVARPLALATESVRTLTKTGFTTPYLKSEIRTFK